MKKRVYLLPCALAILAFCMAVLLMCQAFFADKLLPFVAYGGGYNKIFNSLLWLHHNYFIMLLGAIASVVVAFLRRERYGLTVLQTAIFSVIFPIWAWLGTRFLFGFEKVIVSGKLSEFNPSGQSLYGGIIFAAIYVVIMSLCFKKGKALLFDFVAPLGMIVVTGARLACFVDGCCGAAPKYVGEHYFILPVQLFEVVLDLLLIALLLYLEQSKLTWGKENKKKSVWDGNQALIVMVCYGTYRFILEFFRNNPRFWLNMTLPMYYSIICVAVGAFVIYYRCYLYEEAIAKQKRKEQRQHKKK